MPTQVLVLAARGDDLAPALQQLVALTRAGVSVVVATRQGFASAPELEHQPLRSGWRRWLPGHSSLPSETELVDSLQPQLTVVLGDLGSLAQKLGARRIRQWPAAANDLTALLVEAQCQTLAEVDRLMRVREHDDAVELIRGRSRVSRTMDACGEALLAALQLTTEGEAPHHLKQLVTAALAAADREWERGQAVLATHALGAALRLLFHPDLHADVEDPMLAREPREFLGGLHASSMFQAVSSAPAAIRPEVSAADGNPQRAVLLTGTYPRFAKPVADALAADPGTELREASLGDVDPRFKWLGFNLAALAWMVSRHADGAAASEIASPPPGVDDLFDGADLVWADWGDRGAMWASVTAPPTARMVVRLHGMDLFSPWVHFIAWERVNHLVLVSEPYRQLAVRILGPRLAGVRVWTIDHGVDPARFLENETQPGAERLLGMVGWGKIVKDPMWALDVLELLRADDPSWRLLLVGDEMTGSSGRRASQYEAGLRARLDGPLGEAVELVPFTDDVAAQVARMGFVLSSSRRESFHLAVAEGALGGAVPVVRDWPVFIGGAGPAALFPSDWVVADPASAAARIRALSDPETRMRAGREARAEALERFSPDKFARQVREVAAS